MADHAPKPSRHLRSATHSPAPTVPSKSLPGRSNRGTRSQSREISDTEPENGDRKVTRSRSKKSPAISDGDSTLASTVSKNGRKKRKREAVPLEDLPEADEGSQISYPVLPQKASTDSDSVDGGPAAATRKRKQDPRQSGSGSTFSGTTARTSGSGQDFSEDSILDMLGTYEDLSTTSDKILALLLPRDVSEASVKTLQTQLTDPRLLENKKLARFTANFNRERDVYGSQRFIQVGHVFGRSHNVSSRSNNEVSVGRMKPTLYKANITSFVSATLSINDGSIEHSINELDQIFPAPFLDCFVDASAVQGMAYGSALLKRSLGLGLDIRTQKFIHEAKGMLQEPGFDSIKLLEQTFCEKKNHFRGWNVTGMRNQDIAQYPRLKHTIRDHVEDLRAILSGDESLSDQFETLDRDYSQTQLAANVLDWCQLRLEEIKSQLQAMDEANSQLLSSQEKNNEQPVNSSSLARHPPPNVNADTALPISHNEQAFEFGTPKARHVAIPLLKGRIASVLASKGRKGPSSNAVHPATPTAAELGPRAPASAPVGTRREQARPLEAVFFGNDEESLMLPEIDDDRRGQVDRVLRRHVELSNEGDKENIPSQSQSQLPRNSQRSSYDRANPKKKRAFIDAQPNAVRITWDDTQGGTQGDLKQPAVETVPNGSRGEEEDLSQDGGFQTGSHQIARGYRHPFVSRQPKSRIRQAQSAGNAAIIQGEDESLATQVDESPDVNDRHDRQSIPAPTPLEHCEAAKRGSKASVAQRPKDRKLPVSWSPEQMERLLDMIARCKGHRVSWAQIETWDKNEPPSLFLERGQVALKDKATIMKMDFLKSGFALPPNFEYIRIRKRNIEELERLGIGYDVERGKRTDDIGADRESSDEDENESSS
ncbi:MAG: hypothetical protein Q9174_002484 [Haloplaca sp. 1 TL-2023]